MALKVGKAFTDIDNNVGKKCLKAISHEKHGFEHDKLMDSKDYVLLAYFDHAKIESLKSHEYPAKEKLKMSYDDAIAKLKTVLTLLCSHKVSASHNKQDKHY